MHTHTHELTKASKLRSNDAFGNGAMVTVRYFFPVDGGLRLSDVRLNDGVVYWREERPKEKGRGTVCSFDVVKGKKTPENIVEITPSLNVATRVQEYGGSSYLIGNSTIVLSDKSGELLYGHFGKDSKIDELRRVVSKERKLRFADGFVFEVDPFSMQNALYQFLVNEDGSFVMICEDHTESAPEKVQTRFAMVEAGPSYISFSQYCKNSTRHW